MKTGKRTVFTLFAFFAAFVVIFASCDQPLLDPEEDQEGYVTVSFDKNDAGATGKVTTQKVPPGFLMFFPDGDKLMKKTGYHFDYWNTEPDDTGKKYKKGQGFFPEDDCVFYAQWAINPDVPSFKVTFNADGGLPAPEPQTVAEGGTVTQPPDMTKYNHTFAGWYKEPAFTTQWDFDNDTVTANITLYAKWELGAIPTGPTVTFNTNGGNNIGPVTVTAGTPVTRPPDPTRSGGYTFDDWYSDNPPTTLYEFSTPVNADITLYANWISGVTYTVTFEANGGSPAPGQQTVDEGKKAVQPPAMTKADYAFGGWYSDLGLTPPPYEFSQTVTGDKTLYAKWNPTYTVVFDKNDVDAYGTTPNQNFVYGTAQDLYANSFNRVSYDFVGWATAPDGAVVYTNQQNVTDLTTVAGGTVTLYAVWSPASPTNCTVTFDINSGTGTTPSRPPVTAGISITLPDGTGFSRGGYTFAGWNTQSDGTGSNYAAGSSYTVNADITLYAKWDDVPTITYTVTFNGNGATSGSPPTEPPVSGSINLPGAGSLVRTGYTFGGWNTQADGLGTGYNTGDSFTPNNDVDLFAVWNINSYTVTFHANGGTGTAPFAPPVNYNTPITLPDDNGMTKDGHTFGGWNENAAGTETNYAVGFSYAVTGDITLYAKWNVVVPPEEFTVTFDGNGATGGTAPSLSPVRDGDDITIPGAGSLVKTDYIFGGWNTLPGGGTTYNVGDSYTVTSDTTLYAKWTPLYTVTFDINGGTGTPPPAQTVTQGASISLPGQDDMTEPAGYTFSGWNTQADGMGTNYNADSNYLVINNATLYANWVEE